MKLRRVLPRFFPTTRSIHTTPARLHAPPSAPPTSSTISPSEISHFSSLSAHWWDPTGEFGLLHKMNIARIQFVKETLEREREVVTNEAKRGKWLEGVEVLDVGCGGGIFAESLTRLGASTLAIDAAPINISVARTHAALDPSLSKGLEYRHCAAEDLVQEQRRFDVVCAMEVIEHVEDPRGFLGSLRELTKPGGLLLLSTISRTPLAHFLTLTMAESVLRLVTPGTHTYSKYIKPSEFATYFEEVGWEGMEKRGCIYDPLKGRWRLLGDGDWGGVGEGANYFVGVRRPLES